MRRTISPSRRSTCSTTRSCGNRCVRSTSSRASWATSEPCRVSTSSTRTSTAQIRARNLSAIYVTGPGHGGPALVANAYLEGTYSELYPNISRDADGLKRALPPVLLPRRDPKPRGARGARLDPRGRGARLRARPRLRRRLRQPRPARRLRRRRRRGRDRSLAASWHSNKLLNPRTDGAVLPVLHLNGFKIANPTVLARIPERELVALFEGYGWRPIVVSGGFDGEDPAHVHRRLAAAHGRGARRDRSDSGDGAQRQRGHTADLADANPANPQGLDGAQGSRREADGGQLAVASGADGRRPREPCAHTAARGLAAELPARGALRRGRPARARARRARAGRRAADERQPAHERRRAAARARPAGFPRLRGRGDRPRHRHERGDARPRRLPARHRRPEPADVPALRPRRDRLEPARRRLLGHEPNLARRAARTATRASPRTGA